MLDALGYHGEAPPPALAMEPRSGGGRLAVPVLDVVLSDLPLGHEFVIAEAYESKLLHANLNPTLHEVVVGPMPTDWAVAAELPSSVLERIKDFRLFDPLVESRGSRKFWKLTHSGNGPTPTLNDWRSNLGEINTEMREHGYSDWAGIVKVETPPQEEDLPVREAHDFAGIYLARLEGLEPAADVCEQQGLHPDRDVIKRLLAIGGQTKAILRRLAGFAFLIGGIVLFYMSLVQVQRNEQKIAEIGMLKAMGMTPRGLLAVALAEASLLWLFGLVLAALVVPWLGPVAAIQQTASGASARIVYSWRLIAATAVMSFGMCVASNVCASWRSRTKPASESLRSA
jgi:hypothetical protein